METRGKTRAGQIQLPPESVLPGPEPRPPVEAEEDWGLAPLLDEGEVPTVGRDRLEVRATTGGPGDSPVISEWVPAREPATEPSIGLSLQLPF